MTRLADVTSEKRFAKPSSRMGSANAMDAGRAHLSRRRSRDRPELSLGRTQRRGQRGHRAAASATFDAILRKPPVAHLSFVIAKDYESTECLRRWCWCDALFMSPPAWLELAHRPAIRVTATSRMAEFWATTDFLYDPVEKLYFRDSRFFERRDDKGRKLFWSRGNGWVFAGIANMLDALPEGRS